jgi:hypothetical protein
VAGPGPRHHRLFVPAEHRLHAREHGPAAGVTAGLVEQ